MSWLSGVKIIVFIKYINVYFNLCFYSIIVYKVNYFHNYSVHTFVLPTLPEHLSSPPVCSGVDVTLSLVLCVCFVDHCLSFYAFSLGHCQCSRIPVSRYLWQVNFGQRKVDFQTFVVRGQVNFNYWIEELILNYFKTFSFP